MKFIKLIIFFSFNISVMLGQFQNFGADEAEDLFINNRFTAIWPYYQSLLKTDSLNADLNYKMGVCYLNSRSQKEKAVPCFKKVIEVTGTGKSKPVLSFKLLADAYYLAANYDEAMINYKKTEEILLRTKSSDHMLIEEVERKIEMCKINKELKELKELTIALINDKFDGNERPINSSNFDYSTTASAQQSSIIFNVKRPLNLNKTFIDKAFFDDYYSISETNLPLKPGNQIKGDSLMETTVATSVDGQIILIYKDENGEGNLYMSRLNGNKWMEPEKLNKVINSKGWEQDQCISVDGRTLYFSSTRKGGYGGKDIYKSIKLFNGEWGKAVNLGPNINTPYDEEAPFIHSDGITFYFSSNRNKTKNNFDNFRSSLTNNGIWGLPINVGYPSYKQDSSISETKGNNNKLTSFPEKENYRVTFMDERIIPITLIKGKIIDKDGNIPKYVEISVTNNETGEIAGIFHPDSKTGKYVFMIPTGKNNNITYEAEGYLFHSENVDTSKVTSFYKVYNTIELVPIAEGSKVVLNNIFFEKNVATLSPASDVELNKLFTFLNQHPRVTFEILTFIGKESTATDLKLAEEKIASVINYLIEKGIRKESLMAKVYQDKSKKKKKTQIQSITENKVGKLELKIVTIN